MKLSVLLILLLVDFFVSCFLCLRCVWSLVLGSVLSSLIIVVMMLFFWMNVICCWKIVGLLLLKLMMNFFCICKLVCWICFMFVMRLWFWFWCLLYFVSVVVFGVLIFIKIVLKLVFVIRFINLLLFVRLMDVLVKNGKCYCWVCCYVISVGRRFFLSVCLFLIKLLLMKNMFLC